MDNRIPVSTNVTNGPFESGERVRHLRNGFTGKIVAVEPPEVPTNGIFAYSIAWDNGRTELHVDGAELVAAPPQEAVRSDV